MRALKLHMPKEGHAIEIVTTQAHEGIETRRKLGGYCPTVS